MEQKVRTRENSSISYRIKKLQNFNEYKRTNSSFKNKKLVWPGRIKSQTQILKIQLMIKVKKRFMRIKREINLKSNNNYNKLIHRFKLK